MAQLSEVMELYKIKRNKYKEVDERLDKVLFMEAIKEIMMEESINARSRELMKGVSV